MPSWNDNAANLPDRENAIRAELSAATGTLAQVLGNGHDAGALQINNLADPTSAQDAATKSYVDSSGVSGSALSLASSSAVGDTTLTLKTAPPAYVGANSGFLVIDPGSTSCETRLVSSVSNKTVTLADAFSVSFSNVWFSASGKTISLGRRISSISGSGSTVTVVTSVAHGLSTGNTVVISGTTAYNTFSTGTTSAKTITVTNSTTFTYAAATTGAESAGSVVLASNWAKLVNIFNTEAITISGTSSNNGIFTVAASGRDSLDYNTITVNETLTDEVTAGSVTFKVRLNKAHSAGVPVVWMADPRIPLVWYGYQADGQTGSATTNRIALQRANDDSYRCGRFTVVFPASASAALIDAPVYQEREVPWQGISPIYTLVKAATGFSTGTDIYMCHARVDGRVNYPSWYNNALGRMNQRGINWNGGNIAGINGVFVTSQQPGEGFDDVRVQNCPSGTGLRIQETQQFDIGRLMLINNQINLHLMSAEEVNIVSLDTETPGASAGGGCHILLDQVASAAAGNNVDNLVFTVNFLHAEDTGSVGYLLNVQKATNGIKVANAYHGIASGSTTLNVAAGAGHNGSTVAYDVAITYGGSPSSAFTLNDPDRSISSSAGPSGNTRTVYLKAPYAVGGSPVIGP